MVNKFSIRTWALTLMFLLSVWAVTPIQAVQYANLYVHVTDCCTGAVLPSTYVTASGEDYRTGYTDSTGTILFQSLRLIPGGAERYDLTASKSGYTSKSATTYVYCSQTHHYYMCLDRIIVCGVDVSGVTARADIITSTVKNTGNNWETIQVSFIVDSHEVGSTSVTLNAGESRSVSYSYSFGCGNHEVMVEAIADCGSTDSKSTAYNKKCACTLNANVYDEDRNAIDASVYLDGAYRAYSSFFTTQIAPGSHKAEAKKPNYDTAYANIECLTEETINVDLVLKQQKCVIEVHVKDMAGEMVNEALVQLDGIKQLTGSNGIVIYDNLDPKTHRASASKSGFGSDSASVTCVRGERKIVELFLKENEGNLKVHVSDCATRDTIEGADVDVISGVHVEGTTNEFGYAYFSELPKANYEVSAKAYGYKSNYKNNIMVYEDRMTVVDVCLIKEVGIVENEKCELIVHVRDEYAKNLQAGIYVNGQYRTYNDYYKATFDHGMLEVKAERPGYEPDVKSVQCGGGVVDAFLILTDGGNGGGDGECTVNIYVRDEDDDAINANIYVDGDYEDYDDYITIYVSHGSHKIEAKKSGYETDRETIYCSQGETETVTLVLDKENGGEDCTFRIYVRDEDNDALSASIYIDDDYEGYNSYLNIKVDEGDREIWAKKSGYKSDSEIVECRDGKTETIYMNLRKEDRHDYGEGLAEITAINIEPESPVLGDMIRGEARLKLVGKSGSYETVDVTISIDGKTIKSSSTRFDYIDEEKIITFAVDSWDLKVGTHTIRVEAESDEGMSTKTKTFTLTSGDYPSPHKNLHCFEIRKIEITNAPVGIGGTAKIDVTVENCGDYGESNINLRLENSDVQFKDAFSLVRGAERTFTFDYSIKKSEEITVTVWNSYTTTSKTFQIKPEYGYLAIYIEPDYRANVLEDTKIVFRVRNIGKVEDTFELGVSDNILPWVYNLPESVTLAPQEERDIEMYVSPGSNKGTYQFGITGKSAGSEKTVESTLRVVEPFRLPTGAFFAAIHGVLPWLWWLLLLLLLILLLLLLWWLIKRLRRRTAEKKTPKEKGAKEGKKGVSTDYGEEKISGRAKRIEEHEVERIAKKVDSERKNALLWDVSYPKAAAAEETSKRPCGGKFWWDKDCIEY
ncbi:MAG: carboxypeptidase regulatory-like domain-containing protein [Candidatus Aenigmatarchaeota archaeon]